MKVKFLVNLKGAGRIIKDDETKFIEPNIYKKDVIYDVPDDIAEKFVNNKRAIAFEVKEIKTKIPKITNEEKEIKEETIEDIKEEIEEEPKPKKTRRRRKAN